MYKTIDDIEKLDNVESAGSNVDENPLRDANLTIFLKNNYRLISTKSMLLQTIELEPFNIDLDEELDESACTFKAEIYRALGSYSYTGNYLSSPDNKIYQEKNGVKTNLSLEEFSSKLHHILGSAIFDFLKERHSSIPFKVIETSNPAKLVNIECNKLVLGDKSLGDNLSQEQNIFTLIEKVHYANQQFAALIEGFRDVAIAAELKVLPKIIDTSLKRIKKFSETELKITLKSATQNICALIATKIFFIEFIGENYFEKNLAVELLGNITNHYTALYEFYYPHPVTQPIPRWKDDRLRFEQQLVCVNQELNIALKNLLLDIKDKAEKNWSIPNKCFISYALASKANEYEQWVELFLNNLRKHLCLAGVDTLLDILDIKYNPAGGNIYQHINKLKQSDCVIIVGTESLFQKHTTGISAVYNELVLIHQNRVQNQGKTLPILLSGVFDNALPPYLSMYTNIIDWREKSYIANLKTLLANIYAVGPNNQKYQKLWKKFEKKYPVLINTIPQEVVIQQLAAQKKLDSEQKKLDITQATELLESVNLSIFDETKSSATIQDQKVSASSLPIETTPVDVYMNLQYANFKSNLKKKNINTISKGKKAKKRKLC